MRSWTLYRPLLGIEGEAPTVEGPPLRPGELVTVHEATAARTTGRTALAQDPTAQVPAHTLARREGPDTSKKAAYDVLPRAGTQRRKILEAVLAAPRAMICTEIEDAAQMLHRSSGVTKRISELIEGDWLKVVGARPSPATNSVQREYAPTDKAREWLVTGRNATTVLT